MEQALKFIDAAAKVLAITGSYALALGVLFNAAFFFGPHSGWIAALSLTDHVTTAVTMLAALVVLSVPLGISATMVMVRMQRLQFLRPLIIALVGVQVTLVVSVFLIPRGVYLGPAVPVTGIALSAGIFFLCMYLVEYWPERYLPNLGIVLVAATLLVAPYLGYASGHLDEFWQAWGLKRVSIEVSGGDPIEGNLIRIIDAGVLVADRDGHWTLVTRDKIDRIREIRK